MNRKLVPGSLIRLAGRCDNKMEPLFEWPFSASPNHNSLDGPVTARALLSDVCLVICVFETDPTRGLVMAPNGMGWTWLDEFNWEGVS